MTIVKTLIVAAAAFLALVSVLEASPQSEGEFLVLWNGEDHVEVTAGDALNSENLPHPGQLTAESFSCAGSTLCGKAGSLPNGNDCDAAKRVIQPNTRYFTGSGSGSTGVCSGHCGLFVAQANCDLQGTEMIQAFDELRNHGCKICGIKTFDDNCQFKMDYVSGC